MQNLITSTGHWSGRLFYKRMVGLKDSLEKSDRNRDRDVPSN